MDGQAAGVVQLASIPTVVAGVDRVSQEPTPTNRVHHRVWTAQQTLTPAAMDDPAVRAVQLGLTLGEKLDPALLVLLASSAELLELGVPFVQPTLTL